MLRFNLAFPQGSTQLNFIRPSYWKITLEGMRSLELGSASAWGEGAGKTWFQGMQIGTISPAGSDLEL